MPSSADEVWIDSARRFYFGLVALPSVEALESGAPIDGAAASSGAADGAAASSAVVGGELRAPLPRGGSAPISATAALSLGA